VITRDLAREALGRLPYSSPGAPSAQYSPLRVTTRLAAASAPARLRTRLSRCLALSPAHRCPRPFRPSLPSALSLGGSGGGGTRSLLARYIKGRSRRTGRLGLQPVAAAAARGAAAGGRWRFPSLAPSGERATPPPPHPRGPLKGCDFFFLLRGDS
jgi:hypothetical protein